MNDFKRLNEISKGYHKKISDMYNDLTSDIIDSGLKICGFEGNKEQRISILRRVADLKDQSLKIECEKLNYTQSRIDEIMDKIYEFVADFYKKHQENLIKDIEQENILDDFNLNLIKGVHKVGLILNKIALKWQNHINNEAKFLQEKFPDIKDAKDYLRANEIYQLCKDGTRLDRIYGILDIDTIKILPLSKAFDEFNELNAIFDEWINSLENSINKDNAYIKYIKALKSAFFATDKIGEAFEDLEILWMDVKSPLQIGHFLEYYEDIYTHSVAIEWDIRLQSSDEFDEVSFKNQFIQTFNEYYEKTPINGAMKELVIKNINSAQVYISSPFIYYGSDLNGLFSAQVVPNDEFVSKNYGKKIFAFVDFIYESMRTRPKMKLDTMVFPKEFLDYYEDSLYKHKEIFKRVYEISTIGHEFGHILFIDEDTEVLMNKSGVFKLIEEYKATTSGIINFFSHIQKEFIRPVMAEFIKRNVSLIQRMEITDLMPYYTEGLIHLDLLFKSQMLKFEDNALSIDFDKFDEFKNLVIKTYNKLIKIYTLKSDAIEFLEQFVEFDGKNYMPINQAVKEFHKFYYDLFIKYANTTLD